MRKNRKITAEEFEKLCKIEPILPKSDRIGRIELKGKLIHQIENVFGDTWYNLSRRTQQAIDYICFLALDRGFVYASPEHIAEKHGIGKSTVYEAIKKLREAGVVYKANRYSKKQNGLGCSVLFFTIHPYFQQIADFLKLDWKAERNTDRKAESAGSPTTPRGGDDNEVTTNTLPSGYRITKDKHSKVCAESNHKSKIIRYVPKEINDVYAHVFGIRLRPIWQKVTQAYKNVNNPTLDRNDLLTVGANVIQRILQIWKKRIHDGGDMTVDEMCAYAYKAARDSFFNVLAELYMELNTDERSLGKSRGESILNPTSERRVLLVDEIKRLRKEKQKEEACGRIPELEYIVIQEGVRGYHAIRRAVMERIIDHYELEYEDIEEIDRHYHYYSTQKHLLANNNHSSMCTVSDDWLERLLDDYANVSFVV